MNLKQALQILGIEKLEDTTLSQLKSLYRELAKEKHPDSDEGSQEDFVQLREAYLVAYAELEKVREEKGLSDNTTLKELTKEELLKRYHHDTQELELRLSDYEQMVSQQQQNLRDIRSQVEEIVQSFEEKKAKLRQELEGEISKLEKSYKSNFLSKLLFFLPSKKMSEEEFWREYHTKVQKYSRKDADTDVEFFKEMLSVYGEGLNQISQLIHEDRRSSQAEESKTTSQKEDASQTRTSR